MPILCRNTSNITCCASEQLVSYSSIIRRLLSIFQENKLRKWVANSLSKYILSNISQSELGSIIREIDLGSHPMPDCKAVGVVCDVKNARLGVCGSSALSEVSTRREMLRMLASHFDPWASLLLTSQRQKKFFKVTLSGIGWDDDLPGDVKNDWKIWIRSMEAVANYSTSRYCFSDGVEITSDVKFFFQLHGCCDASNYALSCVVYLRCLVNRKLSVAFIPGKPKLVLANQRNWVKSRKELEAATLCAELMLSVSPSLRYFKCWSTIPSAPIRK